MPSKTDYEAFDRSAGGWKDLVDAKKFIKNIYADGLISNRRKQPFLSGRATATSFMAQGKFRVAPKTRPSSLSELTGDDQKHIRDKRWR